MMLKHSVERRAGTALASFVHPESGKYRVHERAPHTGHMARFLRKWRVAGRACVITRNEPAQKPEPEPKPKQTSLLLAEPVRSGQSIVFADGDVTVLGSVGSGAEIVAGGSIHIYGTLRGRAMAGVNGNSSARIYCQKIEAELLAIDGYYQTAEEIDETLRNRPAQAWLQGETMKITPLN